MWADFHIKVILVVLQFLCVAFVFQAGDVKETDPSVPSKEDIPTFDEWKKQVMEVEKEKSKCIH